MPQSNDDIHARCDAFLERASKLVPRTDAMGTILPSGGKREGGTVNGMRDPFLTSIANRKERDEFGKAMGEVAAAGGGRDSHAENQAHRSAAAVAHKASDTAQKSGLASDHLAAVAAHMQAKVAGERAGNPTREHDIPIAFHKRAAKGK